LKAEIPAKDKAEGKFHEVKGMIKEKAGKLTNNPSLEAEGKVENTAGKIQKKIGQVEKAVCVGIVPSQFKFALGLGGTYGRGVLVCRKGGNGAWDAPSMFTLGAASVGFQIGGKATDVVFLVMNPEGMKKLVQDIVKLGAELSVAAGPVGRSAEGATDAQLHAEILSYSRTRGLFAGASLDGAVVKQDRDDNEKLYGRKVTAKEILIDGTVRTPRAAQGLDSTLTKYSPKGGQAFARL